MPIVNDNHKGRIGLESRWILSLNSPTIHQLNLSPIIIRGDSDSDWRGCGSWTGPFAAISSKSEHHEGRHLLSRWMNVDSPTPSSRVGGRLTVGVSHRPKRPENNQVILSSFTSSKRTDYNRVGPLMVPSDWCGDPWSPSFQGDRTSELEESPA